MGWVRYLKPLDSIIIAPESRVGNLLWSITSTVYATNIGSTHYLFTTEWTVNYVSQTIAPSTDKLFSRVFEMTK